MSLSVSDFEAGFYSGQKRQGLTASPKTVPVVVIIWQQKEWANRPDRHVDKKAIFELLFGATDSVAHWAKENSQGRYKLVPVSGDYQKAILGPVTSIYSESYITGNNGGRDSQTSRTAQNDGFASGYDATYAEAVRRVAAEGFDFTVFDKNRDGVINQDELLILIVKPKLASEGNDGFMRPLAQKTHNGFEYLQLQGKRFETNVSELYTNMPQDRRGNLQVAIEELMHQGIHLWDKYSRQRNQEQEPGQLSLTTAWRKPVHLDAYDKLKLGWLNPVIVEKSGVYTLRQSSLTGDALILYNGENANEFFILENRTRENSYDRYRDPGIGDGIAIWHCIQDASLQEFDRYSTNLLRAQPQLYKDTGDGDKYALFSSDTTMNFYPLSKDSSPQKICFKGTPPRQYRILNISRSGGVMTVDILIDSRKMKIDQFIRPDWKDIKVQRINDLKVERLHKKDK